MNIAILGDSFANGETAGSMKLNHTGLTQYLFAFATRLDILHSMLAIRNKICIA